MKTTGLILAGGQSKRMGQDKGTLIWRGKSLVEHVTETFRELCDEILISSNDPSMTSESGIIVRDNFTGIGPIGGIEAGLSIAQNPLVLVLSCDTPLVPSELFSYIIPSLLI